MALFPPRDVSAGKGIAREGLEITLGTLTCVGVINYVRVSPPNHNVKGAYGLSPGPTPLKESIDGGVYVAVMLEVIELF